MLISTKDGIMRIKRKIAMRAWPLYRAGIRLCSMSLLVSVFSCSTDRIIENTVVHTDTLDIHDTIVHHDTVTNVRWDTLLDTMRYAIGNPPVTCAGIVVSGIQIGSARYPDSIYASLSVNANPPLRSLSPTVNDSTLRTAPDPDLTPFAGGFVKGMIMPDMAQTVYDRYFNDTSSSFFFRIPIPFYASDTATSLSWDTLSDSILLPDSIDSLVAMDTNGALYDSVDYFGVYANDSLQRRIPLNRDLQVRWAGKADWYGIECGKYYYYYGSYYYTGAIRDTFTTGNQTVIPHEYFYHDTADDSTSYDFLYVSVIPVNGPPPARWDTLSDFQGKGSLLCMRGDRPTFLALSAYPKMKPEGGLGKRTAASAPQPPNAMDILGRILAKQR